MAIERPPSTPTIAAVRPGNDAAAEAAAILEEPYEAINIRNFEKVPQIQGISKELRQDVRVVAQVLPFKSNRYVMDHLIDWDRVPDDPMFRLTFPQREMLQPEHYDRIASLLARDADNAELREAANEIRLTLNPHPAGQMEHNVPTLHGKPLMGMQHKYRETVLFFPSQGQTCHAYCTFCFRWPQFVGMEGLKFAMRDGELLREYVEEHPEVSDILFTGGDPLIMKTRILRGYIEPLLEPGRAPNISTIRIGSKALAYWPQRLISDDDADELLDLFRRVVASGRQLAMMSHFNHPVEVEAPPALEAIRVLRETGAQIRTQTPLLQAHQRRLRRTRADVAAAGPDGLHPLLPVRRARHGREALLRAAADQVLGDLPRGLHLGQRRRPHRARAEYVGYARQGAGARRLRGRRRARDRAAHAAGPQP